MVRIAALQLNASKTALIWFGSRQHLAKIPPDDLTPNIGSAEIHPSDVVRDLGILLDSELTMKQLFLATTPFASDQPSS